MTEKWRIDLVHDDGVFDKVPAGIGFIPNNTWTSYIGEAELVCGYAKCIGYGGFNSSVNTFGAFNGNITAIKIRPTNGDALVNANTYYVFGVRA